MHLKAKIKRTFLVLCFMIFGVSFAFGGVPDVAHVMVTDVTTVSFSVVWAASEASTADLKVYFDAEGTNDVTEAVITPHPVESRDPSIKANIKSEAEKNGVMKVRVTGLSAATTYYFKTITKSISTEDSVDYPATAPFKRVTTEVRTVRSKNVNGDEVPFSNDIIIEPCYLGDGIQDAAGTLLIATFGNGDYPLTAFVGDGIEPPYALIDLNNAFNRENNETADCSQGENLTLLNFRGIEGYSIVTHDMPLDEEMSKLKTADFALTAGANMISFQLEPGDTTTLSVLNPIIDKASAIYAYDAENGGWTFYERDGWSFLNTLNDLHAFTGYYLFMEEDASLKIDGLFSANTVNLKAGVANLVGFRSIETMTLMDAMDPIYDKFESIYTYKNGEWIFFDKFGWSFLNTLEIIEPGRAYWVYVSENCEL